jgi:uncharacterized membrane protein HdeD (DUF308 family)
MAGIAGKSAIVEGSTTVGKSTSAGKTTWLTIEGGLLILLGLAALIMPLAWGIAATLVFAWILIASGMIGLISAFAGRAHSHVGWSLASAVIALVIGATLFLSPLSGGVILTWVIAAYLFFDGVVLVGLAFDHRRKRDAPWTWLLASGLLDLALAGIVVLMHAIGSTALFGAFVGLSLVVAGVALLLMHNAGMVREEV